RAAMADGTIAVQLAYGEIDTRSVTQPVRGPVEKAGVTPRRYVAEVRTSEADDYEVGQELRADIFEPGTVVDVVGTTKGKGTAGAMMRHGFAGVGASHGQDRSHRKPGSTGDAAT